MSTKRSQGGSTPLGNILEEYRKQKNMTLQALADYLGIDVRTLSRWKSGETVIRDIRELKRIADLLEVAPEVLGVSSALYVPFTPDKLDTAVDHVWKLTKAAQYREANTLVDKLIRDIANLVHTEDPNLLRKLVYAQHIAGYVKSQTSRANETALPFSHYHEMEQIARVLNDQTLINIALTYEGDMLQRGGNIEQGIQYLEAARDTTPQADAAARGNGLQLLARAYFKDRRLNDFERAMKEAEALAYEPLNADPLGSTRGQYNAGTVYEEWGRSLGLLGQTKQAMDYLDKAEKLFEQSWTLQRRDMLMKTARAMVLVHGGEIQQGVEVAVEAVDLCRKQGHVRLLERMYGIQQYLDRLTKEVGNAGTTLREALIGPIEY